MNTGWTTLLTMKTIDSEIVRARIAEVARRDAELPDSLADEVAFHMTDWIEDLDAFFRFCTNPGSLTDVEVSELLSGFLVHVPNHVAAAGKLYTGVPVTDIFHGRATSEDPNEVG
jgi:hypothetical protein